MFTRMKQYNILTFFEIYSWQEILGIDAIPLMPGGHWEPTIHYEWVQIKIEPAVFGKLEYYPNTPVVNLEEKPARGYDEMICEGSGVTAFMTLWFTEQGYHVVIWDKEK